jgi:hypothetical protein
MERVTVEKAKGIPSSSFCENLVQRNNLPAQGFAQWVFHPGMLFNSRLAWWGAGGRRSVPHEGIDLCLYRDKRGAVQRLDATTGIPLIFTGAVKHIIDDYLGRTLFAAHDIYDGMGNQCYTIYGHVAPAAGIAPGDTLNTGELFAVMADTKSGKTEIIPHAHISIAWIPENFPAGDLSWERMNPRHRVILVNPLDVLRCSYTILKQKESIMSSIGS